MPILFIDCYDSFTYNLVRLLEATTNTHVAVAHNDTLSKEELYNLLPKVEAVVVGPGPGEPANAVDAGIIPELWALPEELRLPIFGVCFGLQSLCLAFGGSISRLPQPQHGQYGLITHSATDIFAGIPQNYKVIRYHSLEAAITGTPLVALAHCDNVLMGVKHPVYPYLAVQFHPESILSEYGDKLIANFWAMAQHYNAEHGRRPGQGLQTSKELHTDPLLPSNAKLGKVPHVEKHPSCDPIRLCEQLKREGTEFVLLHSGAHPGQWTIIGVLSAETIHLRCKGENNYIGPLRQSTEAIKGDFWELVAQFMAPRLVKTSSELPFLGGLAGYISYEKACGKEGESNSDASLVYIDHCVVVGSDAAYLVGPQAWAAEFARNLHGIEPELSRIPQANIQRPARERYEAKVRQCDEFLRAGDSYELCLTEQTTVEFERPVDPWDLFKQVLTVNPAPHAGYLAFDDTLVSASPERFMRWTRAGICEFRPIKGTVKKTAGVDRAVAERLLQTNKERGENLMIVDLIRHDLGRLLSKVECPQLMAVEEYKTVFQLVSAIEGDLQGSPYSGIDALIHALPPGSMTGAPKVRSVEILQELEKAPRGLYSGVYGYWSISDEGDWSVVIRSAFQYAGQTTWRLGAGGAITVLSEPEAEFEEMETKLESTLRAFSVAAPRS